MNLTMSLDDCNVEYVKKDIIKFDFDYLCVQRKENDNDTIRSCRSRFISTINNIKEYEKYLYLKYWYKFTTYACIKNVQSSDIYLNTISELKLALLKSNNPLNNNSFNKKLKKYILNLEIALSNIKEVQAKLKASLDMNGYIEISNKVVLNNKKALNLMKATVIDILNEIDTYLKKLDSNKLKKSYFIENFYELLNLLMIDKSDKIFEWLEYKFCKIIKSFGHDLSANGYFDECLTEIIEKCPQALIDSCYSEINVDNDIWIRDKFIAKCLRKYKTKDEFKQIVINKLDVSDLSESDFKHIHDFEYMKTLLASAINQRKKGVNILLWGAPGTGKTALAKTLISSVKADGYTIKDPDITCGFSGIRQGSTGNERDYQFSFTRDILKHKTNSVILFDEAEDFFIKKAELNESLLKTTVNDILETNETPVIWTTNDVFYLEKSFLRRFTYICEVNDMPEKLYKNIYEKLANEYYVPLNNDLGNICFDNKITVGVLRKVFDNYKTVKNKDVDSILTDIKNLYKAQNQGQELKIKNHNIRPKDFDSRLLNTSDNLETFVQKIKKLNRYDFSLLLYGVSGSGKSYYGEYLADQIGFKVIKKKASDLESMWVGETEKNIAKAFEEAKQERAVLIIDEGDHFISERSNHNHSWETSRTEEMLQQIETHPYPIIFTTNLMQNIDKAAMRRFTYKTEFKYLTTEQVKIAWNDYFPNAKLPKNIHLSRLCPGDFATVYKKAQFEDFLTDSDLIYKKLEEEQDIKKEMEDFSIRL